MIFERGHHYKKFFYKDFSRHTGGGTKTQTVNAPPQPNPPSLLPEAKPGYEAAQGYYQDILSNPPVYGGPRVAGVPKGTQAGINQLYDIGSGGPGAEELAGRNLNFTTTSGGSLAANPYASVQDNPYAQTYDVNSNLTPYTQEESRVDPSLRRFAAGDYLDIQQNPFFKGAQANILDPIYSRYNTEVRPGIRDRFITAGGEGGTRNMLSEERGISELGRTATDALAGWEAGVYEFERGLQQQAGQYITQADLAERQRASQTAGMEASIS